MFRHTFAYVNLIKRELSFFTFIVNILSTIFTEGFLIFSIVVGRGYLALNITLLSLTAINFAVYTVIRSLKGKQEIRKISFHCYRITKIFLGSVPLVIVISTLAFTTAQFSRIELVFIPLILLMWIFQVVFEIAAIYVEHRITIFADAIKMDVEGVVNPLLKLRNAVRGESYRNDDIQISEQSREKLREELERAGLTDTEEEEAPSEKDGFFTRLSKTKAAIKELMKK